MATTLDQLNRRSSNEASRRYSSDSSGPTDQCAGMKVTFDVGRIGVNYLSQTTTPKETKNFHAVFFFVKEKRVCGDKRPRK